MLGTVLQFGPDQGGDRFYNPAKARWNHHQHYQRQQQWEKTKNNGNFCTGTKAKVTSEPREPENRANFEEDSSKPSAVPDSAPVGAPCCNLDRFLEWTTPSVPARYFSKTRMRNWSTCDIEFQPYFTLGDLWEYFKEWSAYGAGVPLVLNGSDLVVQYYVPYLSGIQIYVESTKPVGKPSRQLGEGSDYDSYRDSSSDGSSDSELERDLKYMMDQRNHHRAASESAFRMERLSLTEKCAALQEGFSSDDGETGNSQGQLIFEFLEQDPPYSREPLADKIADLSCHLPELRTLRSCDLLPPSWISVAWYPIYRIPTGPTLRDLDACFLTFHTLSTPMRGASDTQGPVVTYPHGIDGAPKISLPVFGLASYKFKGSMWTPNGSCERQLANSLLHAADNWLRLLQVDHPDFKFFASHGTCNR